MVQDRSINSLHWIRFYTRTVAFPKLEKLHDYQTILHGWSIDWIPHMVSILCSKCNIFKILKFQGKKTTENCFHRRLEFSYAPFGTLPLIILPSLYFPFWKTIGHQRGDTEIVVHCLGNLGYYSLSSLLSSPDGRSIYSASSRFHGNYFSRRAVFTVWLWEVARHGGL